MEKLKLNNVKTAVNVETVTLYLKPLNKMHYVLKCFIFKALLDVNFEQNNLNESLCS